MRKKFIKILFYSLPVPVILFSLFVGASKTVSVYDIYQSFISLVSDNPASDEKFELVRSIVINVRLPRVLLTFLIGGTLAISGCSIQSIFRNPLTDPYILGLSSGAAFGAALALAYRTIPVQLSAFIFGMTAVGLSYFLARKRKNVSAVSLILAGIIVTGIFTALLTLVQFLSDPFRLQSIVHWTMGNLHNATWIKLKTTIVPVSLGTLVLFIYRWRMNVLALGDDEAKTAGLNPDRDKLVILTATALATSSAVAVAGIIGLYGLIVPHMVRMMVGMDNRISIPLNFFFGGMFLLVIDDFSRSFSGFEIPIGVFTMLIGAPFFIYLMKKTNIGWE
jgi:iron complex transport system permease protein